MAELILPGRPRGESPSQFSLDWEHPVLARANPKTVEAFVSQGVQFYDVANGVMVPRYASAAGATPIAVPSPVGLCTAIPYLSTNSFNGFVKTAPINSPAGGYAKLLWVVSYHCLTGAGFGVLECTGTSDTFRQGVSINPNTLAFTVEVRASSFDTTTRSIVTGTLPSKSGTLVCQFVAGASSRLEVYCDGKLIGSHLNAGTANSFPNAPAKLLWAGTFSGGVGLALAAQVPGVEIAADMAAELSADPSSLFRDNQRRIHFETGASGITGALSVTEADDALAATGSSEVLGTSSITEASDDISVAGGTEILAGFDVSEGGDTLSATGLVVQPMQYLRPDSDITQTNFTGGFAEIDETSAADADFAYGANNAVAVLEVGLTNPANTPLSGTTTIRYRVAKTKTGVVDGGGNAVTVTASLYQGTTLISSDTARDTTGTWTEYSWTPDTSTITDWNDLRLRFTTSASGGTTANRRGGAVSWAEVEAPEGSNLRTGSLDITEASDTFSSTGSTEVVAGLDGAESDDTISATATAAYDPRTATAEITEADDTLSGAATVAVSAVLDGAEENDASSAAGTVTVTGSLDAADDPDTIESAGSLPVSGAASIAEDADALASVLLTGEAVASASITEDADTLAATGGAAVSAASSIQEEADTCSAAASMLVSGDLAATEEADTAAAAGVLPISGAASITEDGDTLSSVLSTGETLASLAVTESDDTISSTGSAQVLASASVTEESDSNTSAGAVLATGQATLAEQDDTLATLCSTTVSGVADVLEAPDTLSAEASFEAARGDLAITEGDDAISSAGQVAVNAAASPSEADDTSSAAGSVVVGAAGSMAEDDDSATCAGQVSINAALSITEAADTLQASGDSAVPVASASITEGDDVLSALVGVEVLGYSEIEEDSDWLQAGDPQEQQSQVYGHGKRREEVDPELVREQWELLELRRRNEQKAEPAPAPREVQKIKEVAASAPVDAIAPQRVLPAEDDLEAAEVAKIALAVLEFLR